MFNVVLACFAVVGLVVGISIAELQDRKQQREHNWRNQIEQRIEALESAGE